MRRSGILDDPTEAVPGDHMCFGYGSDEQYRSLVSAFCAAGLDAGDRVLFLSPRGRSDQALSRLATLIDDIDDTIGRGALEIGTVASTYLPDAEFSADDRISAYRVAVDRAVAQGYAGLRVAADATELLKTSGWAQYELRADMLASSAPFTALCAYDRRVVVPEALRETEAAHALSIPVVPEVDPSPFRVHGIEGGGVGISGEIDLTVIERLRDLLAFATQVALEPTIDLSRLTFADAAATRVVALAAKDLAEQHGGAVLRTPPPLFCRIWELAGFAYLAPGVEVER